MINLTSEMVTQTLRYRFQKLYRLQHDTKDVRTVSRLQARMYEIQELALMMDIDLGDPWD